MDARIGRVAVADFFHSFVSQMRAMVQPGGKADMPSLWNDAKLARRLNAGDYEVDLGSVIPSALEIADLPDIAALIAPRRVLFCQARDHRAPSPMSPNKTQWGARGKKNRSELPRPNGESALVFLVSLWLILFFGEDVRL